MESEHLDDDSCEDLGCLEESDVDESDCVVDTCVEGSDLSGNTTDADEECSDTDDEVPLKQSPIKDSKPAASATGDAASSTSATGDSASASATGETLHANGFFYLKGLKRDLKMFIHDRWIVDPPFGLGRYPTMSRTIKPSTVGEDRSHPERSRLCCKAWMIWRARHIPGWIESDDVRARLFREESDVLLKELKILQPQIDGVLGNTHASDFMREWVPDIVSQI